MADQRSLFPYGGATVTTSTDTRSGILLRLHKDESGYFVASDLTGLRYGYAATELAALDEWWEQVSDIISMKDEELGGPLLAEVTAYRKALA